MIEVETGGTVLLTHVLKDGSTGESPVAHVIDSGGAAIVGSPFSLTHIALGLYQDTISAPAAGDYSVNYVTAGFENDDDLIRVHSSWDELQAGHTVVGSFGEDADVAVSSRGTADAGDAMDLVTGAVDADALATDGVDEIVLAVWDRVLTGATHNIVNSAGRILRQLKEVDGLFDEGTLQAGTASTVTLRAGADANDDFFNGALVALVSGTGLSQERVIVDYNGTTKVATVSPDWVVTPGGTTDYVVGGHAGSLPVSDALNVMRDAIFDDATRISGGDIDQSLSTTESNIRGVSSRDLTEIAGAGWVAADNLVQAHNKLDGIQTDIDNFENITKVKVSLPTFERPGSSSVAYEFFFNLKDDAGDPVDADGGGGGTVTLEATAHGGSAGDRNSNLTSVTMTNIGTGRYRGIYNVASGHALEGIHLSFSWAEGGNADVLDKSFTVIDADVVGYVSSDRTRDDAIALETTAILADTAVMEPLVSTNLNETVSSRGTADPGDAMALTVGAVDDIWDELIAGHLGAGSTGEALDDASGGAGGPTAADIADAVWDEDIVAAHGTADTAGLLTRALGAGISQRSNNANLNALLGVADSAGVALGDEISDAVWDELIAGHLGAGSTGESLNDAAAGSGAAVIADAVWDEARASHTNVGSFGEGLDAQVSTRAVPGSAMALTGAERTATAGVVAPVVWDEPLPGAHAVGTAGERLATTDDRVDVAVGTRAAPGAAMGLAPDALNAAAVATSGAAEIAGQVWDELVTSHQVAGSFGAQQSSNDAAAIADAVWDEALNTHLTVGSAGEALRITTGQSGDLVRDDALAYDANDRPTLLRRRIFPDQATAESSTAGGTGEGEIMTFQYDASHLSAVQWESLLRRRTA